MNGKEIKRVALVEDLVSLSSPVQDSVRQLAALDDDDAGETATLTKAHLVAVLKRYRDGKLTAIEVEEWANAIENRDDIDFDPDHESEIDDIMYDLANPTLEHHLSPALAAEMLAQLSTLD